MRSENVNLLFFQFIGILTVDVGSTDRLHWLRFYTVRQNFFSTVSPLKQNSHPGGLTSHLSLSLKFHSDNVDSPSLVQLVSMSDIESDMF